MKRIWIFLLIACAFSVSAAWAQQAQSPTKANAPVVKPLVLYDDFNGRWIDPAKWRDWSDLQGVRHAVIDLSPSYQGAGNNRRLRMFQRANSLTIGNQDVRWGWLGLQVPDPASITEISFVVLVNSAAISGCQSNPNTGGAWSGFVGRFFNYQGQEYGDAGDVEVGLSVVRDGTDARVPLRVDAHYGSEDGSANEYQTLGFVPLGQTAKLRVKWDQPNHQFIFQLNQDPEVFMGYTIPEMSPPNIPIKALWVGRGTPDCTTTPLASTMMDAYFDNVYVNAP
jgi:hypothetical protein